jgi:hypothetical protein
MAGWILNIDAFTRIVPTEINMKFTTAFAFLLSGIALWCIDQEARGARETPLLILPVTAMTTVLVMATLLAAGIFGIQTGISELFVKGLTTKTVVPGMPSIPIMIGFILFGTASILSLFTSPKVNRVILYVGMTIFLIGLVACFGYLFQIPILYYKFAGTANPSAPNTALMFVLLGLGLVGTQKNQKHENNQ